MRVIGVDPGNCVTGFGLVERNPTLSYVASGTIRAGALKRGPQRLALIYAKLLAVIDDHQPAAMSLERSFVAANVQSAFTLGEARAMAMLAAAHRGLALFEYAATDVKLTIAGHGRADKAQVKTMVRRTLGVADGLELADDAADALALAMCHLFRVRFPRADARPRRPMMPAQVRP